jgi:hypothetical protein
MPTSTLPIAFHQVLNPLLWDGNEMRVDVRVALLKSAYSFLEFLDIEGLELDGVHFTGSNASFNYTDFSDCDIHLVVDYDQTPCPELAENLFTTKKTLWNQTHGNVTVRGYSVELYVEDTGQSGARFGNLRPPLEANGSSGRRSANQRLMKMPCWPRSATSPTKSTMPWRATTSISSK